MELKEQTFSKAAKAILRYYPAAIGSRNWPDIARLADKDIEAAKELASRGERNKHVAARNDIARRLRVLRVSLFDRIKESETEIRALFTDQAQRMYDYVVKHGDSTGKIGRINMRVKLMGIEIRKELKRVIYALIRDGAKMGFKNAGDALLPIFQANRESFRGETEKLNGDRLLFEAKLAVSLNARTAGKDPRAKMSTTKWSVRQSKVIRDVAKKNLAGQTFSERVVDLSARVEADMRRRIANGIANGESPYTIAQDVKKYVGPYNADVDAETGPGLYKNPFRNAMRIARTETNRAYSKASAEFAKGKSWIKGMMITLSPAHEDEDVCDDYAGKVVDPDEFEDLVPFHPHCVAGDTEISILDGMAAVKSLYSGEMRKIFMSDGRRFSVTANHHMLTRRGFIPAKLLHKGDEIIDCLPIERVVFRNPDDERMPSSAMNVFEAIRKSSGMAPARVPVSAEYLHGDGAFCKGEIDVVGANRFLLDNFNPARTKDIGEPGFDRTYSNLPIFTGRGDLEFVFDRISGASPYASRFARQSSPEAVRASGNPKNGGLGLATQSNPDSKESLGDESARTPDRLSQVLDGLTRLVTTAQISEIEKRQVSDFPVYDFHTKSTLYTINGLISSNCMCYGTYVLADDAFGEAEN